MAARVLRRTCLGTFAMFCSLVSLVGTDVPSLPLATRWDVSRSGRSRLQSKVAENKCRLKLPEKLTLHLA